MIVPVVKSDEGYKADIFSTLLENRIIILNGQVDENAAGLIVSQLLYLEAQDPKKDIIMYINSPGGVITDGMAIYDTMQYVKCDVQTVCIGLAASMGSFLLAGGTKGKRFALPNAEVMIHQPLGGAQGQATDIAIRAEHILMIKDRMARMYSEFTGKSVEEILRDIERDRFLTAQQALEYGLIDKIVTREEQQEA